MDTRIIIFKGDEPIRLDKYLTEQLADISRSQIQRLIKEENVKIDNLLVTKAGYLLNKRGISIEISIPDPSPLDLLPEEIPLDILFEDDNVIVINKPAGMVMHPGAGHATGTLVHAALGYNPFLDGIGGKTRPGIVHRLDKNTSGVVIVAKNEKTHKWLQEQFKSRLVKKIYVALVDKHPPTKLGKIEAPIYRDRINRKKMTVAPEGKGKPATTIYRTIRKYKRHSLLEVEILTGRTHQIRVHLSSIGSPITGDTVYGYKTPTIVLNRQFLHAKSLELCLPGERDPREFAADIPKDLEQIIEELNNKEK